MNHHRLPLVTAAVLTVLLPLACAGVKSRRVPVQHVTGQVTYLERMALPPDAEITVTLADVSRADAPAKVIARTTLRAEGLQVPIPFDLAYDPTAIDPASTYAVRAQIRLQERLLFTSDTAHQVLTRGNPDEVDLILVRVPSPVSP